jgi:hypothetical protein
MRQSISIRHRYEEQSCRVDAQVYVILLIQCDYHLGLEYTLNESAAERADSIAPINPLPHTKNAKQRVKRGSIRTNHNASVSRCYRDPHVFHMDMTRFSCIPALTALVDSLSPLRRISNAEKESDPRSGFFWHSAATAPSRPCRHAKRALPEAGIRRLGSGLLNARRRRLMRGNGHELGGKTLGPKTSQARPPPRVPAMVKLYAASPSSKCGTNRS